MTIAEYLIRGIFFFTSIALFMVCVGAKASAEERETREMEREDPLRLREDPLQELFIATAVYPQRKGELQTTFLPEFRNGRSRDRIDLPLFLELGVTDQWQVEVKWRAFTKLFSPTEQGVGDLSFETQYSSINTAGTTNHFALGFKFTIPLGDVDKDLSEGFLKYEPFFILARDFPEFYGLQLFSQQGLSFVQRVKHRDDSMDDPPAAHEFLWNTGFFVPYRDVIFVMEFNWLTNQWNHDGDRNEQFLTPGLIWAHPLDGWLGLGIANGLNDQSDHQRFILQIVQEFDVF
jgi:hypothetical protein